MNQPQYDTISQTMALRHYIESMNHQEIITFLNENKLSQGVLNTALTILTQNYSKGTQFLDMLRILLSFGADINSPIVFQKGSLKIEEKDKITLGMFSIMRNDIDLLQLLLSNHSIEINQQDAKKRNAIIFSVIYDNNDNYEIVQMLIKAKADIDTVCKIEIGTNPVEIHSVFTYAISKNLLRIVKVLIDNQVNVNYQLKSNKDTGLHIAVKKDYIEMASLLLTSKRIFVDQINDEKMKPVDIAKIRNHDIYNLFCQYYASEKEKKNMSTAQIGMQMNNNNMNMNNSNSLNGPNINNPSTMGMNIGNNNIHMNDASNMIMNEELHDIQHNQIEADNSLQSSDVGENVDEEDKTQAKMQKMSGKNTVSNKTIELLKKKLSCTLAKKTQGNQYLEISIDFKKNISNPLTRSSTNTVNSNHSLDSFLSKNK